LVDSQPGVLTGGLLCLNAGLFKPTGFKTTVVGD
jgi:hypothetical protein